ncbi:DNA/RNA non-specific endonuclease [Bifidobacterium sp. SO1]|uniref:DNA/RNA non-specific endonuclease n=1 Tax=Bifidobacterium sp. SO1 TaxID=2809029 RepID=UPI001BDBCC3E|nr:DNA/RNA non-specific endonuclease [Bifidobacterium sp. SO1]MBT1162199.1 DNA/RNA non-specific endonuclease [Bifidobacterium sp. SO1]
MRFVTKTLAGLLAGLLSMSLAGCSQSDIDTAQNLLDRATNSIQTPDGSNSEENGGSGNATVATIPEWNLSDYPDYYKVLGKADFANTTLPAAGTIDYATPDSLGRSGKTVGVITKRMRDAGSDRDRHMPDTVTGWPATNPKVQIDLTDENACALPKSARPKNSCYSGYLYNKSHLIAKSLGGEDSAENMVTGTRMQNVGRNDSKHPGGMAYTETEARDWLDDNPSGTIAYMATPVYEGNELLPRYVLVDIKSSDSSIDQHVVVWNTANGWNIDYVTGAAEQVG